MNKWLVVFLTGLIGALGFGLGRWTSSEIPPSVTRTPAQYSAPENYTLATEPPAFSQSEAQDHRASNYANLKSMDDILDLPGDFAQTEALYAIAGRADPAEIEQLIQQSMDIVNRSDRMAALSILFGRYGEVDAGMAVDYLVAINLDVDDQMFATIFDSWAKIDIGAAIAKANQLTNRRQRAVASNAILAVTARTNEGLLDQVAADLDGNFELAHLRGEAIALRANLDPQRALQEALTMDSRQGRWGAISRVALVWGRNDPAGAMQAVAQISDRSMRRAFIAQVMDRWVSDDPVQAMQYVNAYSDVAQRNEILEQSLGVYAKENPQEAFAAALQMTGESQRNALNQVATQWAQDNPGAAASSLMTIDNASLRQQMIDVVGSNIARHGADKAFEWLNSFDVENRDGQIRNVLSQVAQSDPRRALEYALENVTGSERNATLASILQMTSRTDPVITQDYLGQLAPSAETSRLYQQLAMQMATTDSESALQWVTTLSGNEKSNALKGVAYALSQSAPEQASSLIHQMPGEDSGELIQNISRSLSFRDPEGAVTWLEQFRGHPSFDGAMSSVAGNLAIHDPQRALSIAATLGDRDRSSVTSVALTQWSEDNPVAAANWAARSDRSVRSNAISSVASNWGRSDPVRASSWVLSLPSGDGKNQALLSLASVIPPNVDQLAHVVSSISADTMRQQTIRQVWYRLTTREQDERAANAFLDEVGADQELIDLLQSGGRQ